MKFEVILPIVISIIGVVLAYFAFRRNSSNDHKNALDKRTEEIKSTEALHRKVEQLEREKLSERVVHIEKVQDKHSEYFTQIFEKLSIIPSMMTSLENIKEDTSETRHEVKNVVSKMLTKDEHRELHPKNRG